MRIFRAGDADRDGAAVKRREESGIVFEGNSRIDAKRAMLRYWTRHQERLDLDFDQYIQRCRLQSDKRTIVFRA